MSRSAVTRAKTRLSWDGLTLPADHPFWDTHFAPNGWGCRCRILGAAGPNTARLVGGDPGKKLPDGWDAIDPKTGEMVGIDKGWGYMPGATWKPWDKYGGLPDCGGNGLAALTGEVDEPRCIRPRPKQKTWRDHGRPDLRHVPPEHRQRAPDMLPHAESDQHAVDIVASALGLSADNPWKLVKTPIETVALAYQRLPHMVEKEQDKRERYANFILPTLLNPFEIYQTEYEDGSVRPRYIGLFDGDRQIMVVVRIDRDGRLFWNFMQAGDKDMNKSRLGALDWPKQK